MASTYKGEALGIHDWIYCHRVAARIEASNATRRPMAVEVAIDLASAAAAIRSAVPKGGATYVTTADGVLIAGSNWYPKSSAMYDPVTASVIYLRIWDLGFKWTKVLSSDMLMGTKPVEAWYETDMVSVRPLAVGDPKGGASRAGYSDLRLISTAPRAVGISDEFRNLAFASFGVMGAPGAFFLLTLVLFILGSIWWFC